MDLLKEIELKILSDDNQEFTSFAKNKPWSEYVNNYEYVRLLDPITSGAFYISSSVDTQHNNDVALVGNVYNDDDGHYTI